MRDFISEYWEFIIPIILFIYSFLMYYKDKKLNRFNKDTCDTITNIKRFYYSLVMLIYVIFVNLHDVSEWCREGPLGISGWVWSHCVAMLITFLVAIAIDNFIISGYVFQEFGFFGTKFIKEETKKTVNVANQYVLSLENSLKTLYDVPCKIHELFSKPEIIESVKDGTIDFIKKFNTIIKYYYRLKKVDADVDVSYYSLNSVDHIKQIVRLYASDYQLDHNEKSEVYKRLKQPEGVRWYINRKEYSVYIVTINHKTTNTMILIRIKSFNETNLHDAYPIYNFLHQFELEITYIQELDKIVLNYEDDML